MTTKQNPKFQELVAKLREIFQIDRPELDFGIYRILNARAGEINQYLEQRLPEKVKQALSAGSAAQQAQVAQELKEKEAQYQADGIDPATVPKVQELREKLAQYSTGASEHENAVFSHLLAFFSRYYEQGDFISQRRYKGDTYAIPYAGEEVMLHWANKDQYYTKSGENFSNYSFKLEDGRTVHFRLTAADTAKDNRKDNDKERRFVLLTAKTVTRVDDNGDEVEEELVPVEEASGSDGNKELIIRFEYAAQPKGTKQEALVNKAVDAVLSDAAVKARWLSLGNRAPTEKNPQRTLLEKHLSDYTTKNTADYFIHKDLGGFLRRELDFYIKNEVMHLDDVQNAGAFADIEKNLRMIQCLRSIALELITFLAQLEDFQKKLWLKKKFVVSSDYCITLDRIFSIGEAIEDQEEKDKVLTVKNQLIAEILANALQWARWKQLGVWGGDAPGTLEDLKAAPYRMVDTSLFEPKFKYYIASAAAPLDDSIDGLLVHGDNFQSLRLLSQRFGSEVSCVYADPPYNAKYSEIIYKNNYKHSSWLSMFLNRFSCATKFKTERGAMVTAIDENEFINLAGAINGEFDKLEHSYVSIVHNPAGVQGDNFSYSHEYAIFSYEKLKGVIGKTKREGESEEAFRDWGGTSSRSLAKNCFYPIIVKDMKIIGFGEVSDPDFHPGSSNLFVDDCVHVYPVSEDGEERKWVFARASVEDISQELIVKERNGVYSISRIKTMTSYKTTWSGSKYYANIYGSKLLNNIFGKKVFDFPKSVHTLEECLWSVSAFREKNALCMDYFAGSGTTGHAVLNINRSEGGNRKYILIEQGEYFDVATKPRLSKIVFSAEWNGGVPTAPETGISHCFKVIKLESYEDTLNNLQLRRTLAQGDLLNTLPQQAKDDYLLNYLLDVESRGSLLSVEDFKKPFDYQLNVAVDSAGAFEPRKIDLVETFNYLLGLRVKHIDAQPQRGFVTVTGTLPSGESCLVLWRDCDVLDYEGVAKLCDKLAINPADNEFDVVYLNGDHNIPTVLTQTAEEGGATRVLKLRQTEPEFLERMFSVEDV